MTDLIPYAALAEWDSSGRTNDICFFVSCSDNEINDVYTELNEIYNDVVIRSTESFFPAYSYFTWEVTIKNQNT